MRSEISLDIAIARKTSRERLVLCQKRTWIFMLYAVTPVPKWYIHTCNSCVMMARYCELLRKHLSITVKSRHFPARS